LLPRGRPKKILNQLLHCCFFKTELQKKLNHAFFMADFPAVLACNFIRFWKTTMTEPNFFLWNALLGEQNSKDKLC
jgi:hypothetical protein